MQIKDLSQPVTSKKLNESLAKTFGVKLKLEQFSDVQLEDVRNKLRTDLSQMEMNESYDSILENAKYQKTRGLLDVINQAILEREEAAEIAENAPAKGKRVSEAAMMSAIRHRAEKMSVPESWIRNALKRIQLGESDRDELSAELTLRYDLTEAQASWMLLEGEEQKAENILATKDMVGKITNWIEDTAAMKADQLLELLDSIRAEQGSDVASQFNQTVQPALEGVYNALVTAREGLSNALAIVSGEQAETMGAAPDMGADMGGMGAEMGAELGGMPPEGGEAELGAEMGSEMGAPATEAGRMKRESVEYSRRLGMLLSSKKK
jgi:predicted XRE-type DNA-binding protein